MRDRSVQLLRAAAFAALSAVTALAQAPADRPADRLADRLVKARQIVVAPDTVLTGGSVLVRAGKIAYVGDEIPAEARARAKVVDYGDATVVPGFVLAYSTLGQDGDLAENAYPFTPDLLVAEGVDLWHDELERLPRSGVASAAVAPSERQLAGGIAALVKPGADGGSVAASDLFLGLSLTRNARSQDRPPTSLMGALDMARQAFDDAKTGVRTGADLAVLRQTLEGARKVFVRADARREIVAALDLAKEFGLQIVVVGGGEAGELVERLAAQKVGLVLGTLTPEAKLENLELPARLAKAGVPFAFAGQPEQLRLTAALAVKHGLDRRLALAALTRTPATLLGLQNEIGSLRQGAAADFVVFSGDPIDLGSRHLATWIGGERRSGADAAGGL